MIFICEKHSIRATKVILDTNSLLLPFQKNVNIEAELFEILGNYEIIVLSSVIDELKNLAKGNWHAKTALELAKRYKILDVEEKGDFAIIFAAKNINAVVVTNDKKLRRELRKNGICVITSRGHRLWLDGYVKSCGT